MLFGGCMRNSAVLWFAHHTEHKPHRIVIPHLLPTSQPASYLQRKQHQKEQSSVIYGVASPKAATTTTTSSTTTSTKAESKNSGNNEKGRGRGRRGRYADDEQTRQWYPNPEITNYLPAESATEFNRGQHLGAFRDAAEQTLCSVWRDSKSHLRKQLKLTEELGLEGAVRETLMPTHVSFREQLRQRPLDRAILEEIYGDLHGIRSERLLKKGLQWEHWIAKGDGNAPIYTTSKKAQQTFAFGGHIKLEKAATHPHHFPQTLIPGASSQRHNSHKHRHRALVSHANKFVRQDCMLPEVAFIGRTSSGKSSLINAIVNAMITPYSAIRGTTDAVRFYNVADKIMLVDCPGYGYYHPLGTPSLDAENATRVMRAYLRTGAKYEYRERYNERDQSVHLSSLSSSSSETSTKNNTTRSNSKNEETRKVTLYQPRNIKRVFVCVHGFGVQHMDYEYCNLLEELGIPFSMVFTKTDTVRIRDLARLVDYTRSQLVNYKQCKELMLTSALRLAGISKMQMLIANMAVVEEGMHGATMDFDSIV